MKEEMVGIFFLVDSAVLLDAVPVEKGEPYGDAVQFGGHYDFWENLVPEYREETLFKSHAYDYFPRGRVVFFPHEQIFKLYKDSCMQPNDIKAVIQKFQLHKAKVEIVGDEHYQCSRCNRVFLE